LSYSNKFVDLDKNLHDRNSFDCGEYELNTFIKTKACKHNEIGVSKTLVLPSIEILENKKYKICSFFSVAPTTISRETLPDNISKKLPTYPITVFLIAQLGVNKEYHNQGLGKITLIKALEYLWKVNSKITAFAIVVDCLNKDIEKFYSKYGFEFLIEHNNRIRMFIPMKTVNLLFKDQI
jgi:GNAT superfamily N-acetyltransferase